MKPDTGFRGPDPIPDNLRRNLPYAVADIGGDGQPTTGNSSRTGCNLIKQVGINQLTANTGRISPMLPMTAKPITAIIQEGHGVLSIKADANVLQASKKLRYHNIGSLVVMDELGVAVGMVTERDMLNKVLAEAKDPANVLIKDIMTNGVVSINSQTPVPAAQKIMAKHNIRHLPIIENGLLVGMLSTRDILSYQFAAVKSLLKQQFAIDGDIDIDIEFPDMDG